ncbi:MAG: ABC transporter permease subunit [Candidatus Hodarchaeota archaeon]
MQLKLIWELMKKDWAEAFKSKQILLSTTLLPLVLALGVPIIMLFSISFTSTGDFDSEFGLFMNLLPPITSDWDLLSEKAQIMVIASIFGQLFLLMVPVMIASFVSADTIVGEKERDTIEGLLSLPLTDSEILTAKVGSTLLPVMLLTWIMSGVYAVIVDFFTFTELGRLLLPDFRFILLMLIFTPLLGFGTNIFVVMISSRVSSTRDAQQLTGFFVLPAIFLIGGQLIIIFISIWLIFIGIFILGIFDIIAYRLAVSLFSREKLMSTT